MSERQEVVATQMEPVIQENGISQKENNSLVYCDHCFYMTISADRLSSRPSGIRDWLSRAGLFIQRLWFSVGLLTVHPQPHSLLGTNTWCKASW